MILKSNFTFCDVINFRLELIWQKYHIFLIFFIFNFVKFLPMSGTFFIIMDKEMKNWSDIKRCPTMTFDQNIKAGDFPLVNVLLLSIF